MATSVLQPRYCERPAFALYDKNRETAAQAEGRRYEEKALRYLETWAKNNGYTGVAKPWVQYFDEGGRVKYCEIDFLAIGDTTDNLLIIEIKNRHTRTAFAQLERYRCLIAELHREYHISLIEMCRYFDRAEFVTELLPQLGPHSLPHAAVIFEPRTWTPAIN